VDGEVITEVVGMLLEFLKEVGGALATEAFSITYKRIIAEGILDVVFGVIFLMVGVFFILILTRRMVHPVWGQEMRAISLIAGAIFWVMSGFNFYFGLLKLIAPEYETVLRIIKVATGRVY
jgi:hypothetical protein